MKVKDGIIGFVIGDALGVPVEFKTKIELKNNPITDMIGYGTHYQPKGYWSDDSSMMFCTMESIIEKKKIDYDDIMKKFLDWYDNAYWTPNNRVFDIGNTIEDAIERYKYDGVQAIKCGKNDSNSNGNGSLMRILPLAYWLYNKRNLNIEKNREYCFKLSSLTHAHIISKECCFLYVNIAINLLSGNSIEESINKSKIIFQNSCVNPQLKRLLTTDIEDFKNISDEEMGSFGYVVSTLETVVWCLLNSDSYKSAVLKAVNLGQDADTIAALTGALASIYYGYESIPKKWINCLARKNDIMILCERFNDVLGG